MKKITAILLILTLTFLAGCSGNNSTREIAIAEQFGLAYAPVQIMKEKDFLNQRLPEGVTVKWVQLINTAAIREAMLADEVNIGFMAIPPFLIGKDKGMEWRIATGLSNSPLGLITNNPEITSLQDITPVHRIALPQPGSIQHILLSMASDAQFGNAQKFDNQLVTLSHPDGMSALLNNSNIDMHFTSPPYYNQELTDSNMSLVLTGEEAFGSSFTFIVGSCLEDFYKNDKDLYNAFILALNDAINFINDEPTEAAEILAEKYGISFDDALDYMTSMTYTNNVEGIEKFATFMLENNYIENEIEDYSQLVFNGVDYEK